MSKSKKKAILIDGDNAEPNLLEQFINEAGRYGKVTVRRIYGDWTDPHMKNWKEELNKNGVKPSQKFAYTKGKNSTDTALIIDAMDLLHSKRVNAFCIVPSDSDYTGLALRIREDGKFVMGIGRSNTPEAFVKACEKFTLSEVLAPQKPKKEIGNLESEENLQSLKTKETEVLNKIDINLIGSLKESGIRSIDLKQIETAFQMVANIDTGQVLLSRFLDALRKIDPTFDYRNFGYNSFRKFCEALSPNYEMVFQNDGTTMSIRRKSHFK
ncbi:MAG: NYN domain-containing protein [Mariniphaga sp.]